MLAVRPGRVNAHSPGLAAGPSLAGQTGVIHSRQDIAAWALARPGLPPEWRDTNGPGNTPRCQEAADHLHFFDKTFGQAGWFRRAGAVLPE